MVSRYLLLAAAITAISSTSCATRKLPAPAGQKPVAGSCFLGYIEAPRDLTAVTRQKDDGSTVRSDDWKKEHEGIRAVMTRHSDKVRGCYEEYGLSNRADLRGRVMFEFEISAAGTVVWSRIESSTLRAPAVESCVGHQICTWKFPKPITAEVVVALYPYLFSPQE
jgi:hypothetical protein